jgi:hypothetical protein
MSAKEYSKADLEYEVESARRAGFIDGMRQGIQLLTQPLVEVTLEVEASKYIDHRMATEINGYLFGRTSPWRGLADIEDEINRLKALADKEPVTK